MNIELPRQLGTRRKLLLISAIVVGIWLFTVLVTGLAAIRSLERYEIDSQTESLRNELDPAELANSESSINETILAVKRLESSLENVNNRLWFFRVNARVIGWLPFVGSNFRATVDAFSQAQAIANSAEELLLAADDMIGIDPDAISLSTFRTVDNFDQFSLSIHNARVHIEKSIELLDDAPDYSVADLPLLVSPIRSRARTSGDYYDQLKELTNWLSAIMVGVDSVAVSSRGMVEIVGSLDPVGRKSTVDPDSVALEFDRFSSGLERADEHFQSVSNQIPVLLDDIEIAGDIQTALGIFHAARPSIENLNELVMALVNILNLYNDPELGGLTEGKLLRGLSTEWSGLEQSLDHELDLLAEFKLELNQMKGNISSEQQYLVQAVDNKLTETLSVLVTLKVFAGRIEKLVGLGERARYLMLGVNSDEIRASGGFVSNVWVLELLDGAIVGPEAFDVASLDNLANLDAYRGASSELQVHMNAPITLMRDVTWDPHFPSVASQATDIFALSGEESNFNGVFVLNQSVFASLVGALGEGTLDNHQIAGEGVIDLLKAGTDEFGRSFVDQVFADLVIDLNSVSDAEVAFELVKSVSDSLKSRNLQMYLTDEHLQQRLESHQIAGAMSVGVSDRIYVVDSNVGWSKSNQFVTRATEYNIDLSQPDPSAELLITYDHSGSPAFAENTDAKGESGTDFGDDECGNQFNFERLSYEQLGNRCYWNLIRIFVPDGSVVTHLPALPLTSKSVAVQTGRRRVGDETSTAAFGAEGTYISGLMQVAALEKAEFRYEYAPPASIVQEEEDTLMYSLLLSPQPGIIDEKITVSVVLPANAEISSSSYPLEFVNPSTVIARYTLDKTTELVIRYGLSE